MPYFWVKQRHDTTANWESNNPILLDGEIGYEVTVKGEVLGKMGDGILNSDGTITGTHWNDLPYMQRTIDVADLLARIDSNSSPNRRIIIEETCDWTAPVTGTYKITVINGGYGAFLDTRNTLVEVKSGVSGGFAKYFIQLNKGQVVPVNIGAGGLAQIDTAQTAIRIGGTTTFGDLTAPTNEDSVFTGFESTSLRVANASGLLLAFGGGGVGGGGPYNGYNNNNDNYVNGHYYGAGGAALYVNQTPVIKLAGNGHSGAVIIDFFDPNYEPDIDVDDSE